MGWLSHSLGRDSGDYSVVLTRTGRWVSANAGLMANFAPLQHGWHAQWCNGGVLYCRHQLANALLQQAIRGCNDSRGLQRGARQQRWWDAVCRC